MALPILATKLFQPKTNSSWVHREHLLQKLDEGRERKFTLVSAPAGFGKTTLVSNWLSGPDDRVAWLALDDKDNEPRRFFSHLIASLQTIVPMFPDELSEILSSSALTSFDLFLTSFLNHLASVETPIFLVLDDYHMIANTEIDAALTFLLDHQPSQFHLVMTTREDPQLPLPRLRVRRELTEIRVSDLQFSGSEVTEFLSKLTTIKLSEKDISVLEERTEGWAAGLQLAALSMNEQDDAAGFVEAFAGDHHFVLDYLAEEVLKNLPEAERLFLLQTSILERLSASLCNAVIAQTNASDLLEILERRNMFLIPLDNKREWFRYHHLFADVLKARSLKEESYNPKTLHERASLWFEQNGFTVEAIHHALKAEVFEQAAALIELAWRDMDINFQSGIWFAWAKQLPVEIIRHRPVLSVGYAWALLNQGDFDTMEAYLDDAEMWLDTAPVNEQSDLSSRKYLVTNEDEFIILPVTIASARAYKAQALGDTVGTIKHATRALELLPEDDHAGRGIPLSLLGLAYWVDGNLDDAYTSLAEGMLTFRKMGNTMAAISGVFAMADMQVWQGKLYNAIDTYKQALAFVADQDKAMDHRIAILHLGLSELYQEQNKSELASYHLNKSENLIKQNTEIVAMYRRLLFRTRLFETQGKFDAALENLAEAETLFDQIHIPNVQPVSALRVQLWLRQGKLDDALAWSKARGLSVEDEPNYISEFEYVTFARVLIAHYKHNKQTSSIQGAMALLSKLYDRAKTANGMGVLISILILKASAQQAQANISAAIETLQEALRLAEPEGYIRTFVNEGPQMMQLLTHVKAQNIQLSYVTQLLQAFEGQHRPEGELFLSAGQNEVLSEPLTERELEVLHLLAQGFSNRDISKQLFRALDTVKGYNRTIFGKLQVQNRTEAVARARELNLL